MTIIFIIIFSNGLMITLIYQRSSHNAYRLVGFIYPSGAPEHEYIFDGCARKLRKAAKSSEAFMILLEK